MRNRSRVQPRCWHACTARACACWASAGDSQRSSQPITFVSQADDRQFGRRRLGEIASPHLPHPFCQSIERTVVENPAPGHHQAQQRQSDQADPKAELHQPAGGPLIQLHQIMNHDQHAFGLVLRCANQRGENMDVSIGPLLDIDDILRAFKGLGHDFL
jgi:hypothetical protein